MADSLAELDPALHQRAKFWSKQIADALSPTNLALTNPAVLQETIRTGGTNLLQGMQNFLADVQRGRVSQVSADAFEVGRDLAITPGKLAPPSFNYSAIGLRNGSAPRGRWSMA